MAYVPWPDGYIPTHYEGTYAQTYEEMYETVYSYILFAARCAIDEPDLYTGVARLGFSNGTPDRTELLAFSPESDSDYTTHDVADRIMDAFPEAFGYYAVEYDDNEQRLI